MSVCTDEEHETGEANEGDIVVGVISDKPAYLMNAEADGQALALKGLASVRVIGAVAKGDPTRVANDGVGSCRRNGRSCRCCSRVKHRDCQKLVQCVPKV